MDAGRPLSFRSASELTGIPVRQLKARVKDGLLTAVEAGGLPIGVEVSALAEAGLLPDAVTASPKVAGGGNGSGEPAGSPPAERGTWVPVGQSQELVRRLLSEREVLGAEWKERAETLYREIIDEQRARIVRLEEEKMEITHDLRDALRRIPKLMELEDLEAQRDRMLVDGAEQARLRELAEGESRGLRDQVERLERDLAESQRRRHELGERVRRMRARGMWDRLLDRDPLPPSDEA